MKGTQNNKEKEERERERERDGGGCGLCPHFLNCFPLKGILV
jgi:hypothetical protein